MPHYKCTTCKARLRVSRTPDELVGDLCPECGSLLEPVADLAELIGFRTIERFDDSVDAAQTPPRQRIADRVDEFITRRAELLEREHDPPEAERWLDDDDPIAAAASLPLPQPHR